MLQINRRRQTDCEMMFPTNCIFLRTWRGRSVHAPFRSIYCFSRVRHRRRKGVNAARKRIKTRSTSTENAFPLRGGARNVEPFVDARVDGRGRLLLVLGKVELARVGAVIAVRHGGVGAVNHFSAYRPSRSREVVATYRLISPFAVLPVIILSHASAHSRMTSMAYFLFLHSPEKANWFSGLPSGIL